MCEKEARLANMTACEEQCVQWPTRSGLCATLESGWARCLPGSMEALSTWAFNWYTLMGIEPYIHDFYPMNPVQRQLLAERESAPWNGKPQ